MKWIRDFNRSLKEGFPNQASNQVPMSQLDI
jgi:hypothetical protein